MTLSNRFFKRAARAAVLLIAGALTINGCTKVDDTLGGNLIPENQQMKVGFATFEALGSSPRKYVETRLYQTDSIISSNISYGYMGRELNDTLGLRSASFLSQITSYYQLDSGYFGYKPFVDSVQIFLSINSFGRDTTSTQIFEVFEVLSNDYIESSEDSIFYLNFDPVAEGIVDATKPLFEFELGGDNSPTLAAVTADLTDDGKDYVSRLMLQSGKYKGDYSVYGADSLEYWHDEFKGLYIRSKTTPTSTGESGSSGTIYSTLLEASGLAIYARNHLESDPSIINDTIVSPYYFYIVGPESGNVSINSIEHDYSKATSATIDLSNAVETNTDRPLNPRVYVQGMGGIVSEMTFTEEFFDAMQAFIDSENSATNRDFKSLAFTQVKMQIYLNGSDYSWETLNPTPSLIADMNASPARLGLYTNYKTLAPVVDYEYFYEQNYGTVLSYDGYLNRSLGCYVMDITGHVQQLWNSYLTEVEDAAARGEAVDLDNVVGRNIYIAPEVTQLYTQQFSVVQGMATDAGAAIENNASIRFDIVYNLVK